MFDAKYCGELKTLLNDWRTMCRNLKKPFLPDEFAANYGGFDLKTGAIKCEYPKVSYANKGDDETVDCGGNLAACRDKQSELRQRLNKESRIVYYPKFYSYMLEVFNEECRELRNKI